MKTEPKQHQIEGLQFLYDRFRFAANGCEQGTGKTWMHLADAERRWMEGDITGLLVVAPNGVHTNWVVEEIPTHLSCPWKAVRWAKLNTKKAQKEFDDLLQRDGSEELVIFATSFDAINTKSGYDAAKRFLLRHKTMLVVDESHCIKNPQSKRTKNLWALGELAVSRRIASGTLIADTPLDLFAQYEFLAPNLLGTRSYRSFVAQYAVLEGPMSDAMFAARRRSPRGAHAQIVARDASGMPIYQNLERLAAKIKPHTFRRTRDECLDLPGKIYQKLFFEMEPEQRALYDKVAAEMRYEVDGQVIDEYTALTLVGKLRQITSGFVLVNGRPHDLRYGSARVKATISAVSVHPRQAIIWATHREEIRLITESLPEGSFVVYDGSVGQESRTQAIKDFQAGHVKYFVGTPASGGTGITLNAADLVVYHSCNFSMRERLQSEDRAYRIGTKRPVVYIDVAAEDSIDQRIATALATKVGTAASVMRLI